MFIESRGQQVIASALNLIRLIRESFDEEVANDLSKRLVRAIANEDQEKFIRRCRQLREGRKLLKKIGKTLSRLLVNPLYSERLMERWPELAMHLVSILLVPKVD